MKEENGTINVQQKMQTSKMKNVFHFLSAYAFIFLTSCSNGIVDSNIEYKGSILTSAITGDSYLVYRNNICSIDASHDIFSRLSRDAQSSRLKYHFIEIYIVSQGNINNVDGKCYYNLKKLISSKAESDMNTLLRLSKKIGFDPPQPL